MVSRDTVDHLAADLARFLRQQQEAGIEWYLDEGVPEAAAEAEPTVLGTANGADLTPPSESRAEAVPTPPPAPAPSTPALAPAPQPRPDDKAAREAAFVKDCARFVAETLEQLARRAAPDAPSTADLFVPVGEEPVSAGPTDPAAALTVLSDEVAACTACKLHTTRTRTVPGSGDPRANVVFVGEAPGRNEDEQGLPFVGRAGKLLDDILKAIGFVRDEVFICNILKCRPPENRDPERDEVDACESFLKRQLAILEPKVICCLGRHAAMTLLQTKASLRDLRQTAHFYEGIPVVVTYHPAALLRNPHWKRDTWDDVRKLRALNDALVVAESR